MRSRRSVLPLIVLVAFVTISSSAGGTAVTRAPTPLQLERLERKIDARRRVRVNSMHGRFVASGVYVDSLGVHWTAAPNRGTADPVEAPGMLGWPEVISIEGRVGDFREGAIVGAKYGAGVGALAGGVAGLAAGLDIYFISAAIVTGGIGAVAGCAVGALAFRRWDQVYP